jgi:hypothetical protein
MQRIMRWATAMLVAVSVVLGPTASAAQAQPNEVNIGPITICSVITFFDTVIFEWDCHTVG